MYLWKQRVYKALNKLDCGQLLNDFSPHMYGFKVCLEQFLDLTLD